MLQEQSLIFILDARAMKTINFQLSSQRCIDEGYVIRPPSPLLDEEYVAKPFEIEPLDWNSVDQDGQPIDFENDEALFTPRDKVSDIISKETCIN